MSATKAAAAASTKTTEAFIAILPNLLWFTLILILILILHKELNKLIKAISTRVKGGSSIKIAALEIGPSSGLIAGGRFKTNESERSFAPEKDGKRANHRDQLYTDCKGAMLVHKIQHSSEDGQLYDLLVYVIPHKGWSLAGVVSVEYFFGTYWDNKIFLSSDRARGFPVVTSAYGPFLCTAKLNFNDDTSALVSRYVDFEMGGCSPSVAE